MDFNFGRLIFTKKCQNAVIIKLGLVDLVKNSAIPFLKGFQTNSGDDVEGVWKFGVYEQNFHCGSLC
jgi:hypothetical protein